MMSDKYKVQVTYKDERGWDFCQIMTPQSSEDKAFRLGSLFVEANNPAEAEIWVLPPNSEFWKVRDVQGRTIQRRVNRA